MFIDLAKHRFSCRKFSSKKVEKNILLQIIEAARIAPSAANYQPWFFYVISEDKQMLENIYKCYHREWFKQAPAVIVCCANKDEAWKRSSDNKNHSDIDLAIAIDHLTLQATYLGLGTCWICNFNLNMVRQLLNLTKNFEPIALIPVGYCEVEADLNRFEKNRKKMEQITKFF